MGDKWVMSLLFNHIVLSMASELFTGELSFEAGSACRKEKERNGFQQPQDDSTSRHECNGGLILLYTM